MNVFKAAFVVIIASLIASPVFSADTGDAKNIVNVEKKTAKKSSIEIQTAVRETLDGLVDAYVNKNAKRFMSFVAEDFAGDDILLDRSIRRDFRRFVDMDLRYTLNNVTTDSKNENISVAVTFTRTYTSIKTTRRINKTGLSEFVFRMVDGHPKLYAMKRASMFRIGK